MGVRVLERSWLIQYRDVKGLTQEQVADMCDIKRPYYSMIETGKRRPSVDVAKRIGTVLGFDWTIFFALKCNESLPSAEATLNAIETIAQRA